MKQRIVRRKVRAMKCIGSGPRDLLMKRILVQGSLLLIFLLLGGLLSAQGWAGQPIKIGLQEEPKTLNVWLATDAWSNKVLSLIYQPLYMRDPKTLELIPWLAEGDPVLDEKTLAYTIKLRSAKWADGSDVTSQDVAFTGEIVKEFNVPRFLSRWNFIKKMETPDPKTIVFYLDEPRAIFQSRTLTTPIVQKAEWAKVVEEARKTEKPLTSLLNRKIEKPVGCGPFQLKEWRQGAFLFMERNDLFFGRNETIAGQKLGPYMDGIVFTVYGTSDAAILALRKGTIDMFWWGVQSGYIDDLKADPKIRLFFSEKSGLYYMGFNVRRPPFDDPSLRKAVATLIDKEFIVSRILQGLGVVMHSVVPPGNKSWQCQDLIAYGEGLSRQERVKKAYEILRSAGYTWEVPPVGQDGRVVPGKGIRLPNGKPLEKVTLLTPPADYDPHRAMAGMMVQEWLKGVGIPAAAKPMAFGALTEQVKDRREFDAFILGYGRLSLDPDYVRNFFHSRNDKPKGWNQSGYKNGEFDKIADASAKEMDPAKRRQLLCDMQKIVMRDLPYIPLYNPKLVEAVRTDRFEGWVETLEGVGNIWSFSMLMPK